MALTQLILAAKAALTDPVLVDGAINALTLNKDGRLRVSTKPGRYTTLQGNLVAVNDQVALDVSDASALTLLLKNTGTASMTAGGWIFEVSENSTNGTDGDWSALLGVRSNANTAEYQSAVGTLANGANLGFSWRFNVAGYTYFRIRLTTAVTASSILNAVINRFSLLSEPAPFIPSHAVTGSGTFAVTQSTSPWITQSATASAYSVVTTAAILAAVIKASAGNLYEISIFNPSAAVVYVKLYNKTTAPVTTTDIPLHTIVVAAGQDRTIELSAFGKRFTTGMAIGVTGGAGATDTTAPAAGTQISASYL